VLDRGVTAEDRPKPEDPRL
jgi:hypothetical protein